MNKKLKLFEQELTELCKKHDIIIETYTDPCYCEDNNCDCRTTNYYFNIKGLKKKNGDFGINISHIEYELDKDNKL